MSSKTKSTKAGKLLLLRMREYNRVQQSCMGWPNEYNIIQHRGKQKKRCIVQHLFGEKFDRDQTSYNKIQHDKTRYNKVAKRVQHFIKHQSCMMLYEMLYSFGRGLRLRLHGIGYVQIRLRSRPLWYRSTLLTRDCFETGTFISGPIWCLIADPIRTGSTRSRANTRHILTNFVPVPNGSGLV